MKPVCLSKVTTNHSGFCIKLRKCIVFQSNGESKEDCYKECAAWCNAEKEGVEDAVGRKDAKAFKQQFYGSDFFKYIFGDKPKHEDYKQVGSGACLNYCSTKGAPWC